VLKYGYNQLTILPDEKAARYGFSSAAPQDPLQRFNTSGNAES